MKTILFFILAASSLRAADEKPSPVGPKQAPLTEAQLVHGQKALSDAKRLDLEYKLADYRKAMESVQAEYDGARSAACLAIGVPKEKLMECQMDLDWIDPATKTAETPNGKVTGRVLWQGAAPMPAAVAQPPAASK